MLEEKNLANNKKIATPQYYLSHTPLRGRNRIKVSDPYEKKFHREAYNNNWFKADSRPITN